MCNYAYIYNYGNKNKIKKIKYNRELWAFNKKSFNISMCRCGLLIHILKK